METNYKNFEDYLRQTEAGSRGKDKEYFSGILDKYNNNRIDDECFLELMEYRKAINGIFYN